MPDVLPEWEEGRDMSSVMDWESSDSGLGLRVGT